MAAGLTAGKAEAVGVRKAARAMARASPIRCRPRWAISALMPSCAVVVVVVAVAVAGKVAAVGGAAAPVAATVAEAAEVVV